MDPVVSHVAGALVLARMMIVAFDGIQIAGAVGCILRCLVFAQSRYLRCRAIAPCRVQGHNPGPELLDNWCKDSSCTIDQIVELR